VPERTYSDAEIDAVLGALTEPGRLREAQDLVTRAAPQLQHVLIDALHSGGWFGEAHESEVSKAAGEADPEERRRLVRTLIAEETRVGMLVGVAVGFELARELDKTRPRED
jgi:hypothetical protein